MKTLISKFRFGLANLILFTLFIGSCLGVYILNFPWQHEWTFNLPRQPVSGTFSPDGKFLVTAGFDAKSHIFSIADGQEIGCISWQVAEDESRPAILHSFFSLDGNYIYLGAEFDRIWRAFDIKTGRRISNVNSIVRQEGEFWSVDGYPDQMIIPTKNNEKGSSNGAGTRELYEFKPAVPYAKWISYSLDQERIAVVQYEHKEVQVWKRRIGRGLKGQLGRPEVCLAIIFGLLWLGRVLFAILVDPKTSANDPGRSEARLG